MSRTKGGCAEDYALKLRFQEVCSKLHAKSRGKWLAKPLAYWTLPRDRRLPYALLDRTVAEIIDTPFEELSATPGIGRKKIASLVMLLQRVLADQRPPGAPAETVPVDELMPNGQFDPGLVSESLWEAWRETVRRHNLSHEKLGRLAPTLRNPPGATWHTPLSRYLHLGLAQIRSLRTHGDKRVGAILEVFYTVHQLVGRSDRHHRLAVRLVPAFVPVVEGWLNVELDCAAPPTVEDMRQNLALPLLNQIEIDAGETVHRLAATRLGIESPPESVRQQARRLGVTRARVYQLLEICSQIMAVRWPEGNRQLAALAAKLEPAGDVDEAAALLERIRWLMFPEKTAPVPAEPVLV